MGYCCAICCHRTFSFGWTKRDWCTKLMEKELDFVSFVHCHFVFVACDRIRQYSSFHIALEMRLLHTNFILLLLFAHNEWQYSKQNMKKMVINLLNRMKRLNNLQSLLCILLNIYRWQKKLICFHWKKNGQPILISTEIKNINTNKASNYNVQYIPIMYYFVVFFPAILIPCYHWKYLFELCFELIFIPTKFWWNKISAFDDVIFDRKIFPWFTF